jgi:hypothetical protein
MANIYVAPNFGVLPTTLSSTIATRCSHCIVRGRETLLSRNRNSLLYPNRALAWYSLILEDSRIRSLNCLVSFLSFHIYFDSPYNNQSTLIRCIKITRINHWNTASYYNCCPQWERSLERRAPSPNFPAPSTHRRRSNILLLCWRRAFAAHSHIRRRGNVQKVGRGFLESHSIVERGTSGTRQRETVGPHTVSSLLCKV